MRGGEAGGNILIEPAGTGAYVANTEVDTVAVLDLTGWSVVAEIHPGRTPDGMAII